MAHLEAQVSNARETVSLLLRGAGRERLDANSSVAIGGSSGSYTSTEERPLSQQQQQTNHGAANTSGGIAGAFIGSVAPPSLATASAWRDSTESWQQRTRAAFARALPISGNAAQDCRALELPLLQVAGRNPGSQHPASCTVPGCRRCQYERWQRMQLGYSNEVP